jgi:signal peptidase I
LAPADTGQDLVKRVIGVGGDRVACCDGEGRVTINRTPLNESYLYDGDAPSDVPFDVTVPAGSLWVMGDHRGFSEDSRAHIDDEQGGMVPVDNVIGRAFLLVWPLERTERLQRPDTVGRAADDDRP